MWHRGVICVGLLLGSSGAVQGFEPPICLKGELISGYISHVRDGDTIVVGKQAIRLQGLAAPERNEPGGLLAKEAMQMLVSPFKVECILDGTRSYDRCVGICTVSFDVAAEMVRMGYARDCPRYSKGRYAEFETARSKALPLGGYCKVRGDP